MCLPTHGNLKNFKILSEKRKEVPCRTKAIFKNNFIHKKKIFQLNTVFLLLTVNVSATPSPIETKDLDQNRYRSEYLTGILKQFSEIPISVNTSITEADSSILPWAGAKNAPTNFLPHESRAIQHHRRKNRRKNRSDLLVNNIEYSKQMTEYSSSVGNKSATSYIQQQQIQQQQAQQQQQQRKKHKQDKHQERKQRNGQRQKLHKNGLRLLDNSEDDPLSGGLFPHLFNVASRAEIFVNATCGENEREEYCKLVDAYPHKKWPTQCGICSAHSPDITKRRSIESIISSTEYSWWQSPNLLYGTDFEYVTIVMDLKQVYEVFFIMLKSANSPRPASWVLERSIDGLNYSPWQYFGLSEADCMRRYELPGQNGKYVFRNDTEVICSMQFSKALPLENGEIHVSLLKNRPGASEQTPELMDFIKARYIRIRFQGMHTTAYADNSVDWLLDAQSLKKRSFYSLKQIRVSARLDCNGHADQIVEIKSSDGHNLGEPILGCICQHNTCGVNCNDCCPLFRNRPFQRGTTSEPNECEVCECNGHAESCLYDSSDQTGICQNCRNNTAGNECEFCLEGFYKPLGATKKEPCIPCNCSRRGSNGCESFGGNCICKEGFRGSRCEECDRGFFGDDCQKCLCDQRGSLNSVTCSGLCQCKSNVGGDMCDACHPGFYDLDYANPDGCTPCWCSGVGLTCASAQLQTLTFESLHNWILTDISREITLTPTLDADTNSLVYGMYDMNDDIKIIYWQAPQEYLGNRLTSYGSKLFVQVSWTIIRGDTSGRPTSGPLIILFGDNNVTIGRNEGEFSSRTSAASFNITLDEKDWHILNESAYISSHRKNFDSPVTRAQFLSVLSSVNALLIRGTYHTDQVETALHHAVIFSGGVELGGLPTKRVEQCVCPVGYVGLSCETCDFGYIRTYENISNQLIGKCVPCPCNGHSSSCDLQSGDCGTCLHNTYGERCERCKVGYYGNSLQGTPNDCKRCACPLLSETNNFSPSCQLKNYNILSVNSLEGIIENSEYICTQCPPGYTGDHCEKCDDNYYGDPTIEGSKCQQCDCAGGPCDALTGECVVCTGNTEGWRCERCKMGYWGDPSIGCEPCDCYEDGSDSKICDSVDGKCLCKPRFTGQKCNKCVAGFTNIDLKCQPCNCDKFGSVNLNYCDPDTGQCECKEATVGLKCDECADGHFGLKETSNGCQECHCSPVGSSSNECDKETGQCTCWPNVTGRRCDKCRTGFGNLTKGIGCVDCSCDPIGSRSKECNSWTGQCDCKPGVNGQRCNECIQGFYGFSIDGCRRCGQCLNDEQICDSVNGRCICPENTRGPGCTQCVDGFWNWQSRSGCRKCLCDHIGSIGHTCAQSTGQCQCREGYAGQQCNICAVGYFGYPECRKCNCDPNGSFVRQDGLIACDANGQCPCKSLVVGLKCDSCTQASFGLSVYNPEGCTRCFCFGRSTECRQSDWSWGHIRMAEARNLSVQYMHSHDKKTAENKYIVLIQREGSKSHHENAEIKVVNDLNLIPQFSGNVSIGVYGNIYHPLYFQLPPQFCGDRTNSYGGNLHFSIITGGCQTPLDRSVLMRFPLVQIHAHSKLVLDFFEYRENEYSLNSTFKVPLHESYWKYHYNSQNVDRATLMIALQNVENIFLRGSPYLDFTEVVLHNVYMDSAIYVYGSTNNLAREVEHCKCPKRYDGLSCQDPAHGFFRWRNFTQSETINIEGLVGRAVPCQCNGRSTECDRESGACINCRENTGGDHCEHCAEGFYGDPSSSHGCQPCPCPQTNRNFAKGCTVWKGNVSCICKPGHSGKTCGSCELGYFNSGTINENGICKSCNCNSDGIRTEGCDDITGQCYCRDGVTGIKCDKCIAERHHLRDHGCHICDNCSLLLLDYIEIIGNKLRRGIHSTHLQDIPPPYFKVEEFEQSFNIHNDHFNDYMNARKLLTNFESNGLLKLDSHAENNKFQWRKATSTALKRKEDISVIGNNASELSTNLGILRAGILETIFDLNNFEKMRGHLSFSKVLEQAQFYIDSIHRHDEFLNKIKETLECARNYFYFFGNASDAAYDRQTNVDIFLRNLNQTNIRISDMRLITDRIIEQQEEIEDLLEHIVNLKNYLSEGYNKINEIANDIYQKLDPSYMLKMESILKNATKSQGEIISQINDLHNSSGVLNISLAQQEDLHREVKKHWLPKAQKHAARLSERSNEYARQFQPTKNGARIAILASSVHRNISDAITFAKQISVEATVLASKTQDILHLPSIRESVIERSKLSLQRSNTLQQEALQKMQNSIALKEKLKLYEEMVQNIKLKIFHGGVRLNNVFANLRTQANAAHAQKIAKESQSIGRYIIEDMRGEMKRNIEELQESIQRLREKFSILDPNWEIQLGLAEENISLTKTNIRLANIAITSLAEQASSIEPAFTAWNGTMFNKLRKERNNIIMARHAADGIKVSLESSSSPRCVRSYLPTNFGLSASNNIKLSFALSSRNGNSPLIYIQGTEGRFISIELRKRHVWLVWSLGGTTVTLVHPLEIQTRDPKYDDAWYHIEANRTLNIGSLLVRRMNNYGSIVPSIPVSSQSDPEHTRFFQSRADRIFVGEYPPYKSEVEPQKLSGLNVVIHKLEVDYQHVGLWNFITTEGMCGGAMVGAQEFSSSSMARYFNGLGYAELKKSRPRPYRKNLFALQMTFKTFDENALLFLAVDDQNNRSVSVALSQGRIVFRIDYGNDLKLEINTTEKYNTKRWVKIEAAREYVPKRGTENGILRVNNDRPLTGSPSVPIGSNLLPDLSKPIYYLGGVSPDFMSNEIKAPGLFNPFLGCMRDVQINGETYDPLESSFVFGVEPYCKEIITRAGFTGNGYIELMSQSLRKRANIGFVFRTLQRNCLLLLSAYPPDVASDYDYKDIRGNYSVSLYNGNAEVWINSGRSLFKMHSNLSLNDGEFHVFNLIKNGRRFELIIDDKIQDVHSLDASPSSINMPQDTGGLYIGGAPSFPEYTNLAPSFTKLQGDVRNVIINNRTINLNHALAFTNVQIGRGYPLMDKSIGTFDTILKTEPMIAESSTNHPEGCLRVGSYNYEPHAFKFGDDQYSYSQLRSSHRNFWHKNFKISFDFRSFYPNGVIFLAAGTKEKPKHYVALLIKDGQLVLIIRGRRRDKLNLTAKLNNGEWHHVTLDSFEKKVTISVEIGRTNQTTSAQMKIPKRISVSNIIYVGGIPATMPVKIPSELLMKVEPFKGCIRQFFINNNMQDLAKPNKHMHVGQCFPRIEQGSYFPGDAYAVYKRNFHVGKYFELEMEFRTSELSGVLMGVSELNGFPALSLELYNGNIVFSCDVGDGVPFRVFSNLPTKYALCNNMWHTIRALYDFQKITLQIDQLPVTIAMAQERSFDKVQTSSPLYIGGIPEIASSGSLLSRENFKGCIRNVSIRNERRDWIDMDVLHNVLLSECMLSNFEA